MSNDTSVGAGQELGTLLFGSIDSGVGGRGDKVWLQGVAAGTTGGGSLRVYTSLNAGEPALSLTIASAASTFTNQIGSTLAGNTATGGGQIYLAGATSNRIDFSTAGVAAPAFTTRSAGTKIVLYPAVAAAAADFAIGIDSSTVWSSVSTTSGSFKWYGGTTLAATLSGAGALTLVGGLTATTGAFSSTVAAGNTTVTGFINVSSTANVGGATNLRSTLTVNGAVTVPNTIAIGNTTVTGFINVSSTAAIGNTTVTGFINVSSTANVGGATNLRSTLTVNGAVTFASGTTKPSFAATRTVAQSIPTATWTKVQFNSETFDEGSFYDSATNYRWTPPAGNYVVSVHCDWYPTYAGNFYVAIYKNGAAYASSGQNIDDGAGLGRLRNTAVTCAVVANGTDYFEAYAYSSAATENTGTNTALIFSGS
jgi:hypothetical protein